MKNYGNLRVYAIVTAALVALMLVLSEGRTAEDTLILKSCGLAIAAVTYKVGAWLYRKGKLGNIDEMEE